MRLWPYPLKRLGFGALTFFVSPLGAMGAPMSALAQQPSSITLEDLLRAREAYFAETARYQYKAEKLYLPVGENTRGAHVDGVFDGERFLYREERFGDERSLGQIMTVYRDENHYIQWSKGTPMGVTFIGQGDFPTDLSQFLRDSRFDARPYLFDFPITLWTYPFLVEHPSIYSVTIEQEGGFLRFRAWRNDQQTDVDPPDRRGERVNALLELSPPHRIVELEEHDWKDRPQTIQRNTYDEETGAPVTVEYTSFIYNGDDLFTFQFSISITEWNTDLDEVSITMEDLYAATGSDEPVFARLRRQGTSELAFLTEEGVFEAPVHDSPTPRADR